MKPEFPQRQSQRLKNYDYSRTEAYFITVCVAKRICLLGDIRDESMHLNQFGEIVKRCWHDLMTRYFSITLDAFVVMPNHVHGIIVIDEFVGSLSNNITGDDRGNAGGETPPLRKPAPLSKIMGYLKYQSSREINALRNMPGIPVWQRSFYGHVVRDEASLNRIREYIASNPMRWDLDRENAKAQGKDDFDRWLESLSDRAKIAPGKIV
jgi:REP element-mobilizing transposase RayT